ncbi:13577_t:CDS:2 [Ambispora gerdemannii]|uniref:13577_t:CDS:1 n=1 Tax=Ambispora gerdemannii TaxID=144530 RepID=A0A9N8ZSE3_9GLOM|nr:13577_t:CDS:2 [Ambispora gerdemannii]
MQKRKRTDDHPTQPNPITIRPDVLSDQARSLLSEEFNRHNLRIREICQEANITIDDVMKYLGNPRSLTFAQQPQQPQQPQQIQPIQQSYSHHQHYPNHLLDFAINDRRKIESIDFIEKPHVRTRFVMKSMAEIREKFKNLKDRAGYESVCIIVPNRNMIDVSHQLFGSLTGEKFARKSPLLQSIPNDFHVFAQNDYLESIGRIIPESSIHNPIVSTSPLTPITPFLTALQSSGPIVTTTQQQNVTTTSSSSASASASTSTETPNPTMVAEPLQTSASSEPLPHLENFSSNTTKKIIQAILGTTSRNINASALAKRNVAVMGWPSDIPFTTDIGPLSVTEKKRLWECMSGITFYKISKGNAAVNEYVENDEDPNNNNNIDVESDDDASTLESDTIVD